MGVYIKDVGMPRGCNECFFAPRCWMRPLDPTFFASIKPDGCPMVEVTVPHGRLIDASKIDYKNDKMHNDGNVLFSDDFFNGIGWAHKCVNDTPTVIPEERK